MVATIFLEEPDTVPVMVTKIRNKSGGRKRHLYIEEWIRHRGLSFEAFGNRIEPNVERQTVHRWAKEQRLVDQVLQAKIAHALDIEPQDLWHHPDRPSIDARLKGLPDEDVRRAIQLIEMAFPRKAAR